MKSLVLVILFLVTRTAYSQAEAGIFTFSDFSWEKEVSLTGEWAVYWNKFVSPEEIIADYSPQNFVKIPSGAFTTIKGDVSKPLSNFGFATYLLKFKNPPTEIPLQLRNQWNCGVGETS